MCFFACSLEQRDYTHYRIRIRLLLPVRQIPLCETYRPTYLSGKFPPECWWKTEFSVKEDLFFRKKKSIFKNWYCSKLSRSQTQSEMFPSSVWCVTYMLPKVLWCFAAIDTKSPKWLANTTLAAAVCIHFGLVSLHSEG